MVLWTPKELKNLFEHMSEIQSPITNVSIDSRTCGDGDLFIALKGPNFDGNDFILDALNKGASLVISDAPEKVPAEFKERVIVCKDSFKALKKLAKAARARCKGKVIAVTGSVGKTSTKAMVYDALKDQAKVHMAEGNFNNHYGVPLSLARMHAETEIAIFELGMSAPGEISELSIMVQPSVAIITTVQPVHLEFFESVEQIARAKAEICDGLRPGDFIILNKSNEWFDLLNKIALQKNISVKSFAGLNTPADAYLHGVDFDIDKSRINAQILNHSIDYKLPVGGLHMVLNSVATLLATHLVGKNIELAAKALEKFAAVAGRGKIYNLTLNGDPITVIDESYNSSPFSLKSNIRHLGTIKSRRKILVLGDMLELGAKSQEFHEDLADTILEQNIDKVFCCGTYMKYLFDKLPKKLQGKYEKTSQDLIDPLFTKLKRDDILLIKGSKSTNMKTILAALTEADTTQGKSYKNAV